ncbi:MAG: hypothetical protein QXR58_02995 [Candidatus Micrarchaeaceae archaeon]
MSKVYKLGNRLVVNLPFDLVKDLMLKEGEEIDFFKYKEGSYIVAKKSDIAEKVIGGGMQARRGAPITELQNDELEVLKKLDTLRYNDRTEEKVGKLLTSQEQKTLKSLIAKKAVSLYKKNGEPSYKYSISKEVYDRFLFGKRDKQISQQVTSAKDVDALKVEDIQEKGEEEEVKSKQWAESLDTKSYIDLLEKNGYIVINNQAEAADISETLENSIRSGNVIGTRAFNKKYYIVLRSFVNRNATKIIKALDKKAMHVAEIAKSVGMDEDGVRSVLYMLSEFGDVSEVRRDVFRVV